MLQPFTLSFSPGFADSDLGGQPQSVVLKFFVGLFYHFHTP